MAAAGSGSARTSASPIGRTPARRQGVRAQRAPARYRGRHDARAGQRARRPERRDHAVDVLVGHHPHHERHRGLGRGRPAAAVIAGAAGATVIAGAAQERPQLVERGGKRTGPGRVVCPVQEDLRVAPARSGARESEQLQAARPPGRRVAGTPGVRADSRDPGRAQRVEHRIRDRHVRRLVSPQQADPGRAQARQLHEQAAQVGGQHGRRRHLHEHGPDPSRPSPDRFEGDPRGARDRPGRRA